ncbi:hypothetical protein RHMOL_Rhmol13G0110800 [Rhododendron molle]|uniref:Uncharacterized protein n=1 Tax=Rhododendron molle TaxID=49168 RepID=A0ACC0L5X0_RHOML|nr:hypothetical protein RHMOL_Rhmol13G0110800 [Rhododendron molle]
MEDFIDTEADDDEDDRLFDIHVDRNVEWGGLSMGKGKEPMTTSSTQSNDNEESDIEAQSDELASLNGSDGEEGREEHVGFNPTSDMADPKFKVGMIFYTRKVFKAADLRGKYEGRVVVHNVPNVTLGIVGELANDNQSLKTRVQQPKSFQ